MFQNDRFTKFGLFAILLSVTTLWVLESSAQERAAARPTRLYPRKVKQAILPRGENLLIDTLQKLADDSGQEIYVAPAVAPDASIRLERKQTKLTLESAKPLLAAAGFELSKHLYKGAEVHWVRQPLSSNVGSKRGSIVLRPKGPNVRTTDAGSPNRRTIGDSGSARTNEIASVKSSGDPGIRVYQQIDGGETKFLVTIEANSAKQAEDIATTVRALVKTAR